MVDAMIVQWRRQPDAYALDIGFIDDEPHLVEVNDAWVTGYYGGGGLSPLMYARWLQARWSEILHQQKRRPGSGAASGKG